MLYEERLISLRSKVKQEEFYSSRYIEMWFNSLFRKFEVDDLCNISVLGSWSCMSALSEKINNDRLRTVTQECR